MPWKESSVYEERMKFVVAWNTGDWTMIDLCNEFGISRVTGYKYLHQFHEFGIDGLKDVSKAPKNHPNAVSQEIIYEVIACRNEHKTWGARKILAKMKAKYHRRKNWPCATTIGRILKRNGLIQEKKKRQRKIVKSIPLCNVKEPNELWCVDYKGYFTVGDGFRCNPLTITDAFSRFLLECKIVDKTDTDNTKKVFTDIFREFGLPIAIRSDNGSPFASNSIAGLSKLSVWWLKLGIRLERIEPGKPYQNGAHERMHKTLKQCTALPPRSSLEEQQEAFNQFKKEYNFERPHEALAYCFPSKLYNRSQRIFLEKIDEIKYPTNMVVEKVSDLGTICYGGHRIFISGALIGENIALEDIDERHLRIYFCKSIIGILDNYTGKVLQYRNPVSYLEGY